MTIDKRALREVAERATKGPWSLFSDIDTKTFSIHTPRDKRCENVIKWGGFDCQPNAEANAEFIAAFNPKVALALLDENIQLQREKDATEAVALALRDDMRQSREKLEAAEKLIAELEARAFNPAILDVIAERQRQQSVEGWTPEHDDEHCNGELAMTAVCYINDTGTVNRNGGKPWGWPWDASWWKPDTRRRNLVKAGALILAEIERIDRAAGIKVKGD
ncbi:ead/Ea22-like family protein [Salmonella enterica subsp. enterica]|nr:ead/Ea22-like family protein [Salmonella enterica subsp. enterica]EEC0866726.1 ead/Ea22-like family protein [Salmonella enterica subsp. enterica serovar Mikawasima]